MCADEKKNLNCSNTQDYKVTSFSIILKRLKNQHNHLFIEHSNTLTSKMIFKKKIKKNSHYTMVCHIVPKFISGFHDLSRIKYYQKKTFDIFII